jgi:putative tricarboxylic transport membrane protein
MTPPSTSRRTFDWDLWTSTLFALLGVVVCVHAWSFPGGTRGVPGPGFFPIVIGSLLIALSLALIATTRTRARAGPDAGGAAADPHESPDYWARAGTSPVLPKIGAILLLLVVYVSLWNVVPFLARTPLLLIAIYRILGEPWPRTLLVAMLLTASLFLVFEGVLSVQL